jgi:transcription termination/antitermination protein NusG
MRTFRNGLGIYARREGIDVSAVGKEPGGEEILADTPHARGLPADPVIVTPPGGAIIPPGEFDRLVHSGWYALYTRSRHEKKLLSELADRSIDVFLPMREVLSRWKDRKKRIWLPLFPGYIFVHQIDTPENRFRVLNLPGAVRFVGHEGHAERIPDEQIDAVRRFLETKIAVDPYPYIRVGQRVEIIAGALKGIQGILVQKKGRFRFVLRVDLIRQAVSIEIDASDVRPI